MTVPAPGPRCSSAATRVAPSRSGWRRLVTTAFAGATGSIAITLIAVALVALFWAGSEFYTTANLTIIGASVTVPLLVGTCSGFALLAGVVDLSIGSCTGVYGRHFRLPDRPPLGRMAGGRHRRRWSGWRRRRQRHCHRGFRG